MKQFILLLAVISFSIQAHAQSPNYVDFEWDIFKFGYVIPTSSSNESGGFSFGGELRYNASDNFSIGLSGQGALFGTDLGPNVDIGASVSSLMVGDYYLKDDASTRAFFGAGLGLYSTGTLTVRNNDIEEFIDGTTGFGIAPRAGFEFGHVRLQGQYNITLKEFHADYLELTLAFTLWGGYKGGEN